MPISSIILNQNNLTQNNTKFDINTDKAPFNRFYLPTNGVNLSNYQIAIQKINMYYSHPNISNENYMAAIISWPTSTGYVDFQWNLTPNFNYESIDQINTALQQFCIQNGLYLIDGASNRYYINLTANSNSYGVDMTLFTIPTSVGTLTEPSNWIGSYPTTSITPKIKFIDKFNEIIGYKSDFEFDGNISQITFTSNFSPQLSPVSSILVSCNIAWNPLSLNGSSNIMSTFTTGGSKYGNIITVESQEIVWYDINSASSSSIIVEFYDQDYKNLNILDPHTVIHLLLKTKD